MAARDPTPSPLKRRKRADADADASFSLEAELQGTAAQVQELAEDPVKALLEDVKSTVEAQVGQDNILSVRFGACTPVRPSVPSLEGRCVFLDKTLSYLAVSFDLTSSRPATRQRGPTEYIFRNHLQVRRSTLRFMCEIVHIRTGYSRGAATQRLI